MSCKKFLADLKGGRKRLVKYLEGCTRMRYLSCPMCRECTKPTDLITTSGQRHLGSSLLTECSDRLKPLLHLEISSLHWFPNTVQACSFMVSACFAGSNQKCYSAAVPGLNSTAWFENYLGSFLEHATVGDLQLFGDEPTVSAGSSWWWRAYSVQNTLCLGGCLPSLTKIHGDTASRNISLVYLWWTATSVLIFPPIVISCDKRHLHGSWFHIGNSAESKPESIIGANPNFVSRPMSGPGLVNVWAML